MIRNNEIYVIRGKELKGLISLLVDLKSVAIEYAKTNESEIEETELVYDEMIQGMLHSQLFKTFKLEDLQQEFSFNELLKNAGIKLHRRN
tara:strand:+ start:663 stop:932 length:270 start_codon:yes stop_codon:yes gene_type:complete